MPIRPALGVLHWASVAALAAVAARAVWSGPTMPKGSVAVPVAGPTEPGPVRAFVTLAGLTAVNPATLIYFVALVVGLRAGSPRSPPGH